MSSRLYLCLIASLAAGIAGCDPPQQAAPPDGQPTSASTVGVFPPDERKEMEDDQAEKEAKFQKMRQTMDQILIAEYDADLGGSAEARAWLNDEVHHRLADAKLPRATVVKLVADLYNAGASRVYATGFTKNGETTMAAELSIVVGPLDVDKRTRVLQVRNDFYKSYLPTIGKADLIEANIMPDQAQPLIQMRLTF